MTESEIKRPSAYAIGSAAGTVLAALEKLNDACAEAKEVGWDISLSLVGTDYGYAPVTAKLERLGDV